MRKDYVVNIGNIGNIGCDTKADAVKTWREYVKDSKECIGRGAQENVVLMIDGEPDTAFDFNWYNWRISRQEAVVVRHKKELLKANAILNRLLERQEDENGC